MTAYPVTSFPNTAHAVFYSYSIIGNGKVIGSFEKFSSSFDRTHERIREIMFNRGPITKEIIWGGTDISVDITHVELYNESILEAFGVSIFTIEDFNQVVDVVELQYIPDNPGAPQQPGTWSTGRRKRAITYKDCVPTSVRKDVDTSSAKVAETMTLQCRTVEGTYLS